MNKKACCTCKKQWSHNYRHFPACKSKTHKKNNYLGYECRYCANIRNIEYSKKQKPMKISADEFHFLLDQKCVWCYQDACSVDRWDSEIGYEKNNVVPSCWKCNKIKTKETPKNFIQWLKLFKPDYEPAVLYYEKDSKLVLKDSYLKFFNIEKEIKAFKI